MKRPYSAPNCEYMTFAVDNVIAASCFEKPDSHTLTASGSCVLSFAGETIFNESLTCGYTESEGYCYYTVDGGILFSS